MVGQRYGVLKEDQLGNYQTTTRKKANRMKYKEFFSNGGLFIGSEVWDPKGRTARLILHQLSNLCMNITVSISL